MINFINFLNDLRGATDITISAKQVSDTGSKVIEACNDYAKNRSEENREKLKQAINAHADAIGTVDSLGDPFGKQYKKFAETMDLFPKYPTHDPLINEFCPSDTKIGIGSEGGGGANRVSDAFGKAGQVQAPRIDPLILDLDGDGIETVGTNRGILFDHDGDGVKSGTGWVSADDGFLVYDKNNDGVINNGGELFGDFTRFANGSRARDGFDALRTVDTNGDGVINSTSFHQLSYKIADNDHVLCTTFGGSDHGQKDEACGIGVDG